MQKSNNPVILLKYILVYIFEQNHEAPKYKTRLNSLDERFELMLGIASIVFQLAPGKRRARTETCGPSYDPSSLTRP
jgi:hypothetical protein